MKIIILGNTNLGYSWFCKTFKQGFQLLGHEIIEIDYRSTSIDSIRKQVYNIRPDIMFTHLTFHPINSVDKMLQLYSDIRKTCGTKIVHVLADARHEPRYNKDVSNAIDIALVNQLQNLEKFKNYWKIPTFYCPYSSLTQEKIMNTVPSLVFNDPVFTGTPNSHPDRTQFIRVLQKIMNIKIFKTQSPEDLRSKTAELSASAKCILGLCTGYDLNGYVDVRPFQYLGAGAFMIMRKFKGMDRLIPDDLYIPFHGYTIDDAEFVKEEFKYWKDKDTSDIRQNAFNFMQKHHSSKVRMGEILGYLKEI